MKKYRNFDVAIYFVAAGTANTTRERLEGELAFFEKHLHLDRVYLEPYRGDVFASDEQVAMCKEVFAAHGIEVCGGITTTSHKPGGRSEDQRLFGTFCYNDEQMLDTLVKVSEFNGRHFDKWIIDDFYFTNCTCKKCREGRDRYNAEHGVTDGSWEGYRQQLLREVSEKYMVAPAKRVNPDCKVIIKFPNWMESFQETGYDPVGELPLFDAIYTGTETRDPVHHDQHLPRYLSFSLMRYFETLWPEHNLGGWFDPFDCQLLEYYLEQAYLTAFSKPKELMLFCFQALSDSVNVPALGFMLDKLDELMSHMGEVVGVPCYIPNASQGEDNLQDYLGMMGCPIVTTPFFPEKAERLLLTASAACDPEIVEKLESFVAEGGKAIVTAGFVKATLERGLKRMTSLRDGGRRVTLRDYMVENPRVWGRDFPHGTREITMPVLEFRNNATWGAVCKGIKDEESYTILARDTYGKGELLTLCLPDAFGELQYLPQAVLARVRREFVAGGVWFEGAPMISSFVYNNDAVIVYPYADRHTEDSDILLHVQGATALERVSGSERLQPLYCEDGEAVFRLRARVGQFEGYRIVR